MKLRAETILAKNVNYLMKSTSCTQLALSKSAKKYGGLSQKTISNIVNAKRSVVLSKVQVLADVFEVPIALLLSDKGIC